MPSAKKIRQDQRRPWTREELVREVRAFYEEYGKSPSHFEQRIRTRRKNRETISDTDLEVNRRAANLQKVCHNHGGYASIREEAGVCRRFEWTRPELVKAIRAFFEEHGKAPSRFKHDIKIRRINGETIDETDLAASKKANNLQSRCHYHWKPSSWSRF